METILSFQTTMNIWPSGSQHKTPHAPKCHYLFRKFIGLLIIDHLIKGKLVRWGDECLFTSGPLVSGWFEERDREASMRRDPRHRTKSGFIQIRQIGAHLMGPLWTSWEPDWPQTLLPGYSSLGFSFFTHIIQCEFLNDRKDGLTDRWWSRIWWFKCNYIWWRTNCY